MAFHLLPHKILNWNVNFSIRILVCVSMLIFYSTSQDSLRGTIHVTDIALSRNISWEKDGGYGGELQWWVRRMYVAPRPDSSADVLWTSHDDSLAVWTRLTREDKREMPDKILSEKPDRKVAHGLVSLPDGSIAVVRQGEEIENQWNHNWIKKYLTEFDINGNVVRELDVDSYDGGWTSRVSHLRFGFSACAKSMMYTMFGETSGGGHYGARQAYVDYGTFQRFDGCTGAEGGGCSHNLAARLDHNHLVQERGAFCMQDGFGGIYQWLTRNCNTYKFPYAYGDPMKPLGDVVAYADGFFVSFAAPRDHADMNKGEIPARTDVGLIWVPFNNTQSAPPGLVWITNTPEKTESLVHLAPWGPKRDKFLIFWVETDTFSVQEDWRENKLKSESTGARYMVALINPKGEILQSPESIGESAIWNEYQVFTSFPNGDIGWANAWRTTETDTIDPFYGPVQSQMKFVRMKYPLPVDGGWSAWAPCDCETYSKLRTCTNPLPVNGGKPCASQTGTTKSGLVFQKADCSTVERENSCDFVEISDAGASIIESFPDNKPVGEGYRRDWVPDAKSAWWVLKIVHPIRISAVSHIVENPGYASAIKDCSLQYYENGKWINVMDFHVERPNPAVAQRFDVNKTILETLPKSDRWKIIVHNNYGYHHTVIWPIILHAEDWPLVSSYSPGLNPLFQDVDLSWLSTSVVVKPQENADSSALSLMALSEIVVTSIMILSMIVVGMEI